MTDPSRRGFEGPDEGWRVELPGGETFPVTIEDRGPAVLRGYRYEARVALPGGALAASRETPADARVDLATRVAMHGVRAFWVAPGESTTVEALAGVVGGEPFPSARPPTPAARLLTALQIERRAAEVGPELSAALRVLADDLRDAPEGRTVPDADGWMPLYRPFGVDAVAHHAAHAARAADGAEPRSRWQVRDGDGDGPPVAVEVVLRGGRPVYRAAGSSTEVEPPLPVRGRWRPVTSDDRPVCWPAAAPPAARRRLVNVQYVVPAEGSTPYRGMLHDPSDDARLGQAQPWLRELLDAAAVHPGDEAEVVVRRTGARPFGDRRYVLVAPNTYAREPDPDAAVEPPAGDA